MIKSTLNEGSEKYSYSSRNVVRYIGEVLICCFAVLCTRTGGCDMIFHIGKNAIPIMKNAQSHPYLLRIVAQESMEAKTFYFDNL